MAPPEYTKSRVAHQRYRDYLNNREYHFKNNPRFTKNVDRLSSWLEFLLHPETHEYDREAFIPLSRTGGGQPTDYQWREVPEPVYFGSGQVGVPASESRFRSVLHEYLYSDFLDPILALSTQHVETGANILAKATAAVNNIYWAGETFTHELANFPSEWKGTASVEAQRFVARLEDVAGQLKLVVDALRNLLPKYGLVIKTARINLDEAVKGLVDKFEEKFHTRAEKEFSFDVLGFVVSVVAAAGVTYITGGLTFVIVEAAIADMWAGTLREAANNIFKQGDAEKNVAQIKGTLWKDLAASYFKAVDGILRDAKAGIDHLNTEMTELAGNFAKAIPSFDDSLPQVAEPPKQGG